MSKLAKPILHLPLNQHTDQKLIADAAGNNNSATLMGNAQLIPDEVFGACIQLDGINSYIDCNKVITSYPLCTMSLWCNPAKTNGENVLFSKETAFEMGITNGSHTFSWLLNNNRYGVNLPIEAGRWYHMVITHDGMKHRVYHNGIKVLEQDNSPLTFDIRQEKKLILGARGHDKPFYLFTGKIAQFRLYNTVLDATEIQQLMLEDQTAMATFRQTHPLAFSLQDDQNQAIIYINQDSAGHPLHLRLENTARQALQLAATPQSEPNEQTHHLALHFRPGTLLEDSLNKIRLAEGSKWQMKLVKQPDSSVKIYLLATQPFKMEAGATHTVRFIGFRAEGNQGTRGTRVELRYQNIAYEGSSNLIRGQRLTNLNIVNHQGKKNIPLHVGFHGSNIILNDAVDDNSGSKNALTLHLTNGLKPDPSNPAKSSIALRGKNASQPTQFILSFDGQADGEHKDWALGTKSQVANIEIRPVPIKLPDNQVINWTPAVGKPGDTFQLDQDFLMPAGATLEFKIDNIKSSSPAGHTNLYLHYENIPGYWEGQFVEVIEKSPLIYRTNQAGFEQVGIGTTDPQALLDVNGDTRVKKLTVEGDLWLKSTNTVYVERSVPTWYPHNEKLFEFAPNYKGDQYRGQIHIYGPSAYEGNHLTPALTIAGNYGAGGSIGIGTKEPEALLDVNGDVNIRGNSNVKGNNNVNNLTVDGNLGLKPTSIFYFGIGKMLEYKPNYKGDQYRGQMHIYAPSAYQSNEVTPAITIAGNYGAGGSIGINKPDPDATLHIGGSLKVDGAFNAPGVPSALFPNPIKSTDNKTIQINNLDLNTHYMYMIVVKLQNPIAVNFDYKLYFNNDKNEANYFTVFTQQFGTENRVISKRAASFANAGVNAFHTFTIYITKSSSGKTVAYGQGGFETPGTDAVWGFQLWHFYLTYTGTGNVTSLTLSTQDTGETLVMPVRIGASSEVRIMKWF